MSTLLLVNDYVGGPRHVDGRWRYWFFEVVVQIMLVLFVLFLFAGVRRFERRHPFLLPLLLLVPAAVLRFQLVHVVDRDYNFIYRPDTIVWCFLLGWAAARASSWPQRVVVSTLAIVFAVDFFGLAGREGATRRGADAAGVGADAAGAAVARAADRMGGFGVDVDLHDALVDLAGIDPAHDAIAGDGGNGGRRRAGVGGVPVSLVGSARAESRTGL